LRLGVLAGWVLLAGCTTTGDGLFSGDKTDYKNAPAPTQSLEVPPDLSQLARDSRYRPQGGVISAAAAGTTPAVTAPAAATAATATVALNKLGALRVERDGQQRWLVAPKTPEELWPLVKAFWEQRGFTLAEEDAKAGLMQTHWSENRDKLPADGIRKLLGRVLGGLYDTGERDLYRTRLERTADGTEIYISHRGIEEVYAGERKESTEWRARPSDPQLEAEFLTRLMVALGGKDEPARAAVAAAAPASAAPAPVAAASAPTVAAARAGALPQATSLTVGEPFDRTWRRVGVALDRSGFTVEDRDRSAGLYFVRYIDPKYAGKEEPGWWSRLFSDGSNPQAAQRYRIAVKGTGAQTEVTVQSSAGAPETSENAKTIMSLLRRELR
jgi:outer membrane protein assembly factor BamC